MLQRTEELLQVICLPCHPVHYPLSSGLPIITFVDTPGAYAGKAAEELGQVRFAWGSRNGKRRLAKDCGLFKVHGGRELGHGACTWACLQLQLTIPPCHVCATAGRGDCGEPA